MTFDTSKEFCGRHSELRQVGGILRVLRCPPPVKTDITELLLKVAVKHHNPIILTLYPLYICLCLECS